MLLNIAITALTHGDRNTLLRQHIPVVNAPSVINIVSVVFLLTSCYSVPRQLAGADFPHYDPLGPRVLYSEPRARSYDVQPPSQAV